MANPSKVHPSQAATPYRTCAFDKSRSRVTSFAGGSTAGPGVFRLVVGTASVEACWKQATAEASLKCERRRDRGGTALRRLYADRPECDRPRSQQLRYC